MSTQPALSVLTPTTRPDGLVMVADCLARQGFRDFEWVVCVPPDAAAPADLVAHLRAAVPALRFVADPPRRPGDFYRLNGALNALVRAARTDLLVFACDWIWFDPDALGKFYQTYLDHPDAIASSWGHHYRRVVNGRPEVLWTQDARLEYVEDDAIIEPLWVELSLCSMPKRLITAVGGFDEEYDRVAGYSEKEAAMRMAKIGAKTFLALGVQHRIWTHPKENPASLWDKKSKEAVVMLERHQAQIASGARLRVPYLESTCTLPLPSGPSAPCKTGS